MTTNEVKDLINTLIEAGAPAEADGVRYIAFAAEKGMSMHKSLGGAVIAVAESCNCWIYKEYNINKRDLIWRYNINEQNV